MPNCLNIFLFPDLWLSFLCLSLHLLQFAWILLNIIFNMRLDQQTIKIWSRNIFLLAKLDGLQLHDSYKHFSLNWYHILTNATRTKFLSGWQKEVEKSIMPLKQNVINCQNFQTDMLLTQPGTLWENQVSFLRILKVTVLIRELLLNNELALHLILLSAQSLDPATKEIQSAYWSI